MNACFLSALLLALCGRRGVRANALALRELYDVKLAPVAMIMKHCICKLEVLSHVALCSSVRGIHI
jgi:hypothetical protein